MMVDYEEKTYEMHFNLELSGYGKVFPIGQVLEGILGFDMGIYVPPCKFDYFKGRLYLKCYNEKKGESILRIFKEIGGNKRIPDFKINIVLQYKRPEYMTRNDAKEWKYWKEPYYRYDIYPRQQEILYKISKEFKKEVLVLYVAPAIPNWETLMDYANKSQVMDNSNFIEAEKFSAHSRATYIDGESVACLHSEIEKVNSYDFKKFIENRNDRSIDNFEEAGKFIFETSNKALSIIQDMKLENEFERYRFRYYRMNEGIYDSFYDVSSSDANVLMPMTFLANTAGAEWYFGV